MIELLDMIDKDFKGVIEKSVVTAKFWVCKSGKRKGTVFGLRIVTGCESPLCDSCGLMVKLTDTTKEKDLKVVDSKSVHPITESVVSFYIDVYKQQLLEKKSELLSSAEKEVAQSFLSELGVDDWETLYSHYIFMKRVQHIETSRLDTLPVDFSRYEHEIDKKALCIGYYEIFPFADQLEFHIGDDMYVLNDHYCLVPGCKCTETVFTMAQINTEQAEAEMTIEEAFRYNYKTYGTDYTLKNDDECIVITEHDKQLQKRLRGQHKQLKKAGSYIEKTAFAAEGAVPGI